MGWLKKILNKWLTRILLICFLALVWLGGWCGIAPHPYQTNPNLKLVVGDTTTYYDDSLHCSNPVVSPDGKKVYYLAADADSFGPLGGGIGMVYSVNIDGSNNKKILDGKFNALSISHSGTKLALHVLSGSYHQLTPESLILVVHVDTASVLGVDSFWITARRIAKIVWSNNDRYLYYYTYEHIVRLDLLAGTEEILGTLAIAGFDLFKNDDIYLDSMLCSPEIEPVSEKYTVGRLKYEFAKEGLRIKNIQKDTTQNLPIPYNAGFAGFPYWFPDGNTIVFAAGPYREGTGAPDEIWILENVFEQIEK